MTHDGLRFPLDKLDEILERERDALLAGRLDRIASILEHKERLLDLLNAIETPLPRSDVMVIQTKLSRNRTLLDGTLQGLRSAAARLGLHRGIRRSMTTYDRHGRKCAISAVIDRKVEKRA